MEAGHADWFLRHRLKLRHLNVLLAVERARNIGRAAQALHTSQPAISKALHEVEAAAGMPLFERRPDGTRPTAAGEALLHYAREVFGALERAGKDLESIAGNQSGALVIGCNFSAAGAVVPRALLLLKQTSPTLRVKVQEGSLEMLLPELRNRALDLVVARWPRGRNIADLEEHALFDEPVCIVCAPGHPLTRQATLAWSALGDWPWVLPPEGSAVRSDLEQLFRLRRVMPQESGIECASPFALSVLLKDMQGLAVCPLSIARHLASEQLFAILPLKMPKVFGPNSVITLRGRDQTPAMRNFLECLKRASSH